MAPRIASLLVGDRILSRHPEDNMSLCGKPALISAGPQHCTSRFLKGKVQFGQAGILHQMWQRWEECGLRWHARELAHYKLLPDA
jgi:hypothetical protein